MPACDGSPAIPQISKRRARLRLSIVKDGMRAAEIIERIRLLFKKGTPQRELVDVNEVIREMIVLLRGEVTRCSISVRTELAQDLPRVMGDRVQLQQVMMNLITNSIDAMKEVDGTRELAIKSQRAEDEQLMVCVSDTGVGLPPQQADQIFNAFFTTKPHGTGMGLSISRSIVESHSGRLWAADNSPRGAKFHLLLQSPRVATHEKRAKPPRYGSDRPLTKLQSNRAPRHAQKWRRITVPHCRAASLPSLRALYYICGRRRVPP